MPDGKLDNFLKRRVTRRLTQRNAEVLLRQLLMVLVGNCVIGNGRFSNKQLTKIVLSSEYRVMSENPI